MLATRAGTIFLGWIGVGTLPRPFMRDFAIMGRQMSAGYQALTDKEKQTLRLIVRGYDAKSIARHLGLSVHTINERLRDARRKMAVSSSREAARMLLAQEGGISIPAPDSLTDKQLGDAEAGIDLRHLAAPHDGQRARRRFAWAIGGVVIMSLTFTLLALSSLSGLAVSSAGNPATVPEPVAAAAAVAQSDVTRSALHWLALVDEGRWSESWNATGEAFKKLNTNAKWTAVSQAVRPPLGPVSSRTASSQEYLPAPPRGYEVVKFRTSFANKPDTAETVTLVREGEAWKVVGYLIG